ncbi:MAG: iron-sulfur cluster assembly scaffold protein [Oscillospiraceae bacterium]|nr:iron-sulfur cluster assembly scaffold protein [Oscillospiraceae bacterium]
MYTQTVLDHFMNPRNVGEMPDADGVGEVGNAKCGDIMKMHIKVTDNVITHATFLTFGCCAAIAASSISTTLIIGKTTEEALAVTNKNVVDELGGLPPAKVHCSVLAQESIALAVSDYYTRHGIDKAVPKMDSHCDSCTGSCGGGH